MRNYFYMHLYSPIRYIQNGKLTKLRKNLTKKKKNIQQITSYMAYLSINSFVRLANVVLSGSK